MVRRCVRNLNPSFRSSNENPLPTSIMGRILLARLLLQPRHQVDAHEDSVRRHPRSGCHLYASARMVDAYGRRAGPGAVRITGERLEDFTVAHCTMRFVSL